MVNRVERDRAVASILRPDPEVETGRALRRLRLARGWSQAEVAARMEAYGYDFHQTMIAKIEAAQRPLRVRELADFAALYGVEVQDLVYPPTTSLSETDQEIAKVEARLGNVRGQAVAAQKQLEAATGAMQAAQVAYQASATEVAVLEGRLASLRAAREKLTSWESGRGPSRAEGSGKIERDALDRMGAMVIPAAGGPTVLRILLGAQFRRLREACRVTLDDAGKAIRASPSKLSRLEAGRVGFKDRDIADLLTLYGVTDKAEREALRSLARQANAPGWWHDYSDILPAWFEAYVGLEEVATQIRSFQVQFIPGLLQTEDYARAVTLLGHNTASAREIERRVRLRMARQAVLDREEPPNLWMVMDEAVLRRPAGGPAVMRGQLKHLTEMAQRPNVTIQVIPFQSGGHTATGGPFTILRFAEPGLPDVVYLEQLTSALYLDRPEAVDSYLTVMERINMEAATPAASAEIIADLLAEH
jgi:transcriptional regulator with XRE-family HTH domain